MATDLVKTFNQVLRDPDPGVPDHLGFSTEVTAALAVAKEDPTEDNIGFARAMLDVQMTGNDQLLEEIQKELDAKRNSA